MDKGALVAIMVLTVTGITTAGGFVWLITSTGVGSDSIIIKSASCISDQDGQKFAFNIYNGGSIPIPQNSIKVESLDGLNLQTTNPEIQPSSIGRVISVHLGDTESKNLKVEILYKDIIAKYIVNC